LKIQELVAKNLSVFLRAEMHSTHISLGKLYSMTNIIGRGKTGIAFLYSAKNKRNQVVKEFFYVFYYI